MIKKFIRVCYFLFVVIFLINTPIVNASTSVKSTLVPTPVPNMKINFSDKNLEKIIRNILKKPEGDILTNDVQKIDQINAAHRSISNLEGLQYLSNLKTLYLPYNNIEDISPLKTLKNITYLNLSFNKIMDISSIANMKKLNYLNIENYQVKNQQRLKDVSVLSNLASLEILYLGNNNINDISSIAKLNKLKILNFQNNEVTNVEPLKNLTTLKTLTFSSNKVSKVDFRNLNALTYLDMSYNSIHDLSSLSGLTKMNVLILRSNGLTSIDSLKNLTNLKSLILGSNNIRNISPVAGMKNLEVLDLDENPVTDASPIISLGNLKSIYLWNIDSKEKILQTETTAKSIINAIIKPGMSDLEIERTLYDYLINNSDYDYQNYINNTVPAIDHGAYSILVNHVGVCNGFSSAMGLLLSICGIENIEVFGFLKENTNGAHSWNIVKIGDDYYHLDVTLEDNLSYNSNAISYRYFNLSDQQIAYEHIWGKSAYPVCSKDNPDVKIE